MTSHRGAENKTELWYCDKVNSISKIWLLLVFASPLKSSVLCQGNLYVIGMPVLILK